MHMSSVALSKAQLLNIRFPFWTRRYVYKVGFKLQKNRQAGFLGMVGKVSG